MKMKMVLGVSLLALATSASAIDAPKGVATVNSVNGNVLIEQNGQRTPAKNGMSLQEGDSVFVLEKASIDLAYAGCNSVLDQNTLLTVSGSAPCATGTQIGVGQVETAGFTIGSLGTGASAALVVGGTVVGLDAVGAIDAGLGIGKKTSSEEAEGISVSP